MGNLRPMEQILRESSKNSKLYSAFYNKTTISKISRVFFRSNSFSINKGIDFIKEIEKSNPSCKLVVTGGGYFQFALPNDWKSNVKDVITPYIEKIKMLIEKKLIKTSICFGVDFKDKQNRTPIQLAVLYTKGKISYVSKSYPVSGEYIIKPRIEHGKFFVTSIGNIFPLVCHDGVIWANRSIKTRSKNSQKTQLVQETLKRIKKSNPKILLDLIHEINSQTGERSGRAFSSSLKSFNSNHRKSTAIGCFGSSDYKFLKQLSSSKDIPDKIKNISGNMIEENIVSDFYIY